MGDHPISSASRKMVAAAMLLMTLATAFPSTHGSVVGPPCHPWIRMELPRLEASGNGSAWDPENGVLWPRGAYWGEPPVQDAPEDIYLLCPCQSSRPCLRKCCPRGQVVDRRSSLQCVPHQGGQGFEPPVRGGAWRATGVMEKHFFIFHGAEDDCEKGGRILLEDEDFFISAEDGSLVSQNGTHKDEPGSFCVDYFVGESTYIPMLCYKEETNATSEEEEMAEVTTVPEAANATADGSAQSTCYRVIYVLYPIGMVISIVFLILSLLVHAFFREMRNLHGKCLMCHIASLLTAYVFLTLVQVFGNYMDDAFCISAGFIIYFSFLSTFLWLNIMCIDMFIAFSGLRTMAGSPQQRDRKKLVMYMAYAWGVPLVILVISLFMEFGPVPDYMLKPELKETCWFNSDSSRVAYFIAPVGVVIACNIVLFVLTAVKIYRLKRETRVLKKGDSRRHQQDDNHHRFHLYLKLFVVMGVNWALEIISWIVGGDCVWIPFDLLNTLQGLFVFLIFVWKVKIRRKLAKKLCPKLAAKLKIMVPKTTTDSDRRTSGSTASSNMASSTVDDGRLKMETVSARVPDTRPSAEETTDT